MSKTYHAEELTFKQLLSKYNDLAVPPFQRSYSWGADEIDLLFEDIIPAEITDLKSLSSLNVHFMGAMVFCRVDADPLAKKGYSILDGQQRMTTLTMLQAALASRLVQAISDGEAGQSDKNKLIQQASSFSLPLYKSAPMGNDEGEFVLKPQADDAHIYGFAMSAPWQDFDALCEKKFSGAKNKVAKSKVLAAYRLIRSKIESQIVAQAVAARLDLFNVLVAVLKSLQDNLSLVVIEAQDESAAFRLFETLNSRGLELSAADLIKNKLFAICSGNKSDEESVKAGWPALMSNEEIAKDPVSFFRTKWLSDPSYYRLPKGAETAAGEARSKAFETARHEFVRKDGLFEVYRDYLNQNAKPGFVRSIMADLQEDAVRLEKLIGASVGKPDCDGLLDDLNSLGAKTCRPLLLSIYRSGDLDTLKSVCNLLISLTIRWTVSKQVTNVLETKYASLATHVSLMYSAGKSSDVLKYVANELYSLKVPDDDKFLSDFPNWRPANVSKLARYALVKLNSKLSGTEEISAGSHKVHVEHLFPQKPSELAYVESGITALEEKEADYASLIGNLTLLDSVINMCIKNDPFSRKIQKHSDPEKRTIADSAFAINADLKTKTKWTREDIAKRSSQFAALAVQVWKWEKPDKAS